METTLQKTALSNLSGRRHRSLWGDAWRRLISSRTARLGMAIVAFFILFAVLTHFFWEYDPKIDLDYSLKLKPPNLAPTEEIESVAREKFDLTEDVETADADQQAASDVREVDATAGADEPSEREHNSAATHQTPGGSLAVKNEADEKNGRKNP